MIDKSYEILTEITATEDKEKIKKEEIKEKYFIVNTENIKRFNNLLNNKNIINLKNEDMQELSKSLIKGDNEMPKKIKLKYGQGSITYRTKEKRYIARYYNNGVLQKPLYGKTQEEIISKLKNAIKNKDKQSEKEIITITLKDWLTQWLETYKKPSLALSSYKSYEINIRKYIIPELGHFDINKLNSNIIQQTLNKIECPRQKEICYNILNENYRKAILTKITKNDYMIAVQKQKANSIKGKALTVTEQSNYIKALNNYPVYKDVFLSYLYTGCRLRELLNIKWEDVNFNDDLITIKGTKTINSNRIIPLSKKLKSIFKDTKRENEFIFNFKADTISRKMTDICSSINIKDYTIHSLRHTFATRCLENNIPAKVVQQWLGHSKINITLDTYTHIQTDFEKKQSNKINDIFDTDFDTH